MLKKLLAATVLAFALALPAFAGPPVNINTADAETIAKSLTGIGPAKAKAIVAFREEHGPFKSAEDLKQVKGIGDATLDRNKDDILLSGGGSAEGTSATPAKHAKKTKANAETSDG